MPIRKIGVVAAILFVSAHSLSAQPGTLSPYLQIAATGKCFKVDLPKTMPSLNVLFDSTTLVNSIEATQWGAKGEVEVSIQYNEPVAVHVIGLPEENPLAVALVSATTAALHAGVANAPDAFRIRIKRDKKVAVKFEKSELCQPAFKGATAATRTSGQYAFTVTQVSGRDGATSSPSIPGGLRLRPTADGTSGPLTKLRVNKLGYVVEVTLLKSAGTVEADQAIRDKISAEKYAPATLDGEPVEVWLTGDKVELVKRQ